MRIGPGRSKASRLPSTFCRAPGRIRLGRQRRSGSRGALADEPSVDRLDGLAAQPQSAGTASATPAQAARKRRARLPTAHRVPSLPDPRDASSQALRCSSTRRISPRVGCRRHSAACMLAAQRRSCSPARRRAGASCCAGAGVAFEVRPGRLDETPRPGEAPPSARARSRARRRSRWRAAARPSRAGSCSAPTRSWCSARRFYGKPRDAEHAVAHARRARGPHAPRDDRRGARRRPRRARVLAVQRREPRHAARGAGDRRSRATWRAASRSTRPAPTRSRARAAARRARGGHASNVIGLPLEETLALLRERARGAARERRAAARLAAVRARIARGGRARRPRARRGRAASASRSRSPPSASRAAVRRGPRRRRRELLQEARAKRRASSPALAEPGAREPRWHFIGRLQRNKARARRAALRLRALARPRASSATRSSATRPQAGRTLDALVQVNVERRGAEGRRGARGACAALLAASARAGRACAWSG